MRPAVVWGLVVRGIALCHFVHFASQSVQLTALLGANGITPIVDQLDAFTEAQCFEKGLN